MIPATFIVDTDEKRKRLANRILALPLEGQVWDVTVKEWEPRRSVYANRRLWALHEIAADMTGHSAEEMHEFCKYKFLGHVYVKVGGQTIEVPSSSATLTVRDFRDFMDRVEALYISELGVMLGEFA